MSLILILACYQDGLQGIIYRLILQIKTQAKAHIRVQLGKACAKASALRRLRKFISKDVMVRLYKAYVLPHLEYCSPLFLGVGNVEASKMESTNYYILRSILGYSKTVSDIRYPSKIS